MTWGQLKALMKELGVTDKTKIVMQIDYKTGDIANISRDDNETIRLAN